MLAYASAIQLATWPSEPRLMRPVVLADDLEKSTNLFSTFEAHP